MTAEEKKPSGLLNSAQELRQLIVDNPDLPLVVFAGPDANCDGDWLYMACSHVQTYAGEFLDCKQTVNDKRCYTDRDVFQEDIENLLCDDFDGTSEEFDEHVKQIMAEYEPYWKNCIILYVDN